MQKSTLPGHFWETFALFVVLSAVALLALFTFWTPARAVTWDRVQGDMGRGASQTDASRLPMMPNGKLAVSGTVYPDGGNAQLCTDTDGNKWARENPGAPWLPVSPSQSAESAIAPQPQWIRCDRCQGLGTEPYLTMHGSNITVTCRRCGGTGRVQAGPGSPTLSDPDPEVTRFWAENMRRGIYPGAGVPIH